MDKRRPQIDPDQREKMEEMVGSMAEMAQRLQEVLKPVAEKMKEVQQDPEFKKNLSDLKDMSEKLNRDYESGRLRIKDEETLERDVDESMEKIDHISERMNDALGPLFGQVKRVKSSAERKYPELSKKDSAMLAFTDLLVKAKEEGKIKPAHPEKLEESLEKLEEFKRGLKRRE